MYFWDMPETAAHLNAIYRDQYSNTMFSGLAWNKCSEKKVGQGWLQAFLVLQKEQELTFQKIITLRLSVDENWGHWGISHPWWDNKRVIPSLFTLPTGLFSFLWVWSEWDQEQARTCAKLWPAQSCSATAAATETSAQLSKPTVVFAKHIYLENISKIFAFKSV